jgi:hypothetical protein
MKGLPLHSADATITRQIDDTIRIQLPGAPAAVMSADKAESIAFAVLDLVAKMRNGWA